MSATDHEDPAYWQARYEASERTVRRLSRCLEDRTAALAIALSRWAKPGDELEMVLRMMGVKGENDV
jgi:hypothetical protein